MRRRDRLILDNMGLAHSLAFKMWLRLNRQYEREDLLSEAMVGLCLAAKTYKRGNGVKFSTYAWHCVHNQIINLTRKKRLTTVQVCGRDCGPVAAMRTLSFENADQVRFLLRAVPSRYHAVLRMAFGFDGPSLRYAEIGKRVGVSRARVQQIVWYSVDLMRKWAAGWRPKRKYRAAADECRVQEAV